MTGVKKRWKKSRLKARCNVIVQKYCGLLKNKTKQKNLSLEKIVFVELVNWILLSN